MLFKVLFVLRKMDRPNEKMLNDMSSKQSKHHVVQSKMESVKLIYEQKMNQG